MLKSQKGRGHYDRFRSRIVFPIRDARGRVQGFGARALLPDQKPKYVNSPEGELYSKRRTLYGIERARPADREERAGAGGGGLHGRARLPPGRDPRRGRGDGDGDHARAGEAALGATPRRRCWRSTPTAPGARRCCARRRVAAASGCGCGSRGCRRARIRPTCSPAATGRARRRFARRSRRRRTCRSSTSARCSTTPTCRLAAGRDRALDEVVEVIAAMPDSITREELMREVADRLDADPGLVARRIGGGGAGRTRRARRRRREPAPSRREPAPRRGR